MLQLITDRVEYLRMAVAEDHWAPGTDVIDVLIAVDIPHMAAFGFGNKGRSSTHRFESTGWTVYPTGHDVLGGFKAGLRLTKIE